VPTHPPASNEPFRKPLKTMIQGDPPLPGGEGRDARPRYFCKTRYAFVRHEYSSVMTTRARTRARARARPLTSTIASMRFVSAPAAPRAGLRLGTTGSYGAVENVNVHGPVNVNAPVYVAVAWGPRGVGSAWGHAWGQVFVIRSRRVRVGSGLRYSFSPKCKDLTPAGGKDLTPAGGTAGGKSQR
jgi:hypothetical protein